VHRRWITESGIKVFNERFSHTFTCGTTAACFISETVSWMKGIKLTNFGDLEIKSLTSHYHNLVSNHYLRLQKTSSASGTYPKQLPKECQTELTDLSFVRHTHKQRFTFLSKKISMVAISIRSYKRRISEMSPIKNKFRSVLYNDNLNDLCLILIKLSLKSLELSHAERVIDRWHFSNKTLRHINSLKHSLSDGSMEICVCYKQQQETLFVLIAGYLYIHFLFFSE
jgi:hypothetical protein